MNPSVFLLAMISVIPCLLTPVYAGVDSQRVIHESMTLLPENPEPNSLFGHQVATDAGIAAVSGFQTNDQGEIDGVVYLFNLTTGEQIARLLPDVNEPNTGFGWNVAIQNGIVAVSSHAEDTVETDTGAVYLFDAATGTQISKVFPSNGMIFQYFGLSIAMDDGILAVSSIYDDFGNDQQSASVRLFDITTGMQISQLFPEELPIPAPLQSLAMDDGRLVIGASINQSDSSSYGTVYVYDIATGTQTDKIVPDNLAIYTGFGDYVAIEQSLLAIGSYSVQNFSQGESRPTVVLYDVTTHQSIEWDFPSNSHLAVYGGPIAISNGILAVHSIAINQDLPPSILLYDTSTGTQIASAQAGWEPNQRPDLVAIALDNHTLVAGLATSETDSDFTSTAYLFDLSCPADLNNDDELDFLDIQSFLSDYTKAQPSADLNNDGQYDFLDISAFLSAYHSGCP